MSLTPTDQNALIVQIVEEAKANNAALGRTALMKLIYFLQALKGVPLDYRFSLYTYGPFDSDVLADLGQVQELGGVKSKTVYYSGGYGYEISPGDEAEAVKKQAKGFLKTYESDIVDIVKEFGGFSPSKLELASTLVFAFQEVDGKISKAKLVERVQKIKPRFTKEQVEAEWESLHSKGYLTASK